MYKFKQDNLSQLIYAYKVLKGYAIDNVAWDRAAWARNSKSAKNLLALFNDDIDKATKFLEDYANNTTLSWTFETVVKAKTDNHAKS